MPIKFEDENEGRVLTIHVTGKLTRADYVYFTPEFERLVKLNGKLRLLFDMTGFHGWDAGGLWEDIKFDVKHFADIERLAMVGEKKGNTAWRRSATRSRKRQPDPSITPPPRRRGGWLVEA